MDPNLLIRSSEEGKRVINTLPIDIFPVLLVVGCYLKIAVELVPEAT